jgi:hypothetical protein
VTGEDRDRQAYLYIINIWRGEGPVDMYESINLGLNHVLGRDKRLSASEEDHIQQVTD